MEGVGAIMKICGHEYKVVIDYVNDQKRKGDAFYFGHTQFSEGLIHLSPKTKRDVQEESLIHEVLHAALFHSNSKAEHNEGQVQAMAGALYQLGVGRFLWEKFKPKEKP